jgi:predicted HicB family RNase H-like nuclease
MAINGIGRPSKGHRIRIVTRVDPLTHLLVARAAAKDELTMSEWLEIVVKDRVAPMYARDGRSRIEAPT